MGNGEGGRQKEGRTNGGEKQTLLLVCNRVFHVGMPPLALRSAGCSNWSCRLLADASAGCQRGAPVPSRAVVLAASGRLFPPPPQPPPCEGIGRGGPKWLPCGEPRDWRFFPAKFWATPPIPAFLGGGGVGGRGNAGRVPASLVAAGAAAGEGSLSKAANTYPPLV